jgi:hypothetical protein
MIFTFFSGVNSSNYFTNTSFSVSRYLVIFFAVISGLELLKISKIVSSLVAVNNFYRGAARDRKVYCFISG